MCFDVPKGVRSPGFDHEHDEKSQNVRDVKIDILEAYVWNQNGFEWFRHFSGILGGYRNPLGSIWALLGLSGIEEREGKRGRHAPQAQSELDKEEGRRPPFSFSPSPSPTWTRKGRGVLLPVGVGLLLRASY